MAVHWHRAEESGAHHKAGVGGAIVFFVMEENKKKDQCYQPLSTSKAHRPQAVKTNGHVLYLACAHGAHIKVSC
jgi:hypothetical protein